MARNCLLVRSHHTLKPLLLHLGKVGLFLDLQGFGLKGRELCLNLDDSLVALLLLSLRLKDEFIVGTLQFFNFLFHLF